MRSCTFVPHCQVMESVLSGVLKVTGQHNMPTIAHIVTSGHYCLPYSPYLSHVQHRPSCDTICRCHVPTCPPWAPQPPRWNQAPGTPLGMPEMIMHVTVPLCAPACSLHPRYLQLIRNNTLSHSHAPPTPFLHLAGAYSQVILRPDWACDRHCAWILELPSREAPACRVHGAATAAQVHRAGTAA